MKSLNIKARKKPAKVPHPVTPTAAPSSPSPTADSSNDGGGSIAFVLDTLFTQGVDLENRTVTIEGEISEGYFSYIDSAFSALEMVDNESPITLRITSPGGDIHAGFAIIARMKQSPCDIIVEAYSVMSMASLILAAGDKRRLSKWGTAMYHTCSYAVSDRHNVVKQVVRQADVEERKAARFMAEHSNKPAKFWLKLGYDRDEFLTPEQALEYGVIDEIFG